jgi:4-amino-4-deoxy-L-arabinose transferase-like glycosyltransferase
MFLVIAAAFLRLWKVDEAALFLGDQGRDALIVSRIFLQKDLVFIGPITSVGNMYLGPLYYYFMLPFLMLSYPSPLGSVYAVAVLGTLTVFFLYYWGIRMVGETAAVIAAFLCTFSVVAIDLSRFSWNPNITPFVGLLMMYATYKAVAKHPKYWLLVGFAFAILLQLHYVTLLAGAAAGLLWISEMFRALRAKNALLAKQLVGFALGAFAIVAVSLLPLFIFDLKHDWLNLHSFQKMFTNTDNFSSSATEPSTVASILRETHGRSMHIFFEFLIGKERVLNTILVGILLIVTALFYRTKPKRASHIGLTVILVYLIVGILGLSTYRNSVFNHYIAYLFPATFLFLSFFFAKLWNWKIYGKVALLVLLTFFISYNVPKYNFKPAGPSFTVLKAVAASIHSRVRPEQPYGIVLIAATKDYHGMNYRYFLQTADEKVPLEHNLHEQADILFIINEEHQITKPEDVDIFEINSFSGNYVSERYTIPGGPEITVVRKPPAFIK